MRLLRWLFGPSAAERRGSLQFWLTRQGREREAYYND
jgi:hypothetical protein